MNDSGIVRVAWPRSKVHVRVDGAPLAPAAGLTSWAAFAPTAGGAMVMGDTVVFEDEVDAAMDAAFANGLKITALHNHFFYDQPKVFFMHIGGEGAPTTMAKAVRAVWEAIRAVRAAQPTPASSFSGSGSAPRSGSLDATQLSAVIGLESTNKGGVVKFSKGHEASMAGLQIGGAMGLTTWAAFCGGDSAASIDGDFAMTAEQVQPVLKALRRAGIHVVALHNHMIGEAPAYYFTHFWGRGPAADLARGFRKAIDAAENNGSKS